jgi:hypothetical protein
MMSGFETGTSLDFFSSVTLGANAGVSATYKRGAYWAMYLTNVGDKVTKNFSPSQTELFTQVAIIWTQAIPAAGVYIKFYVGSIVVATLVVNSLGRIEVYTGDGGVTLRATGITILQQYCWYTIEVHFNYAASGVIEVRLNGVAECSWTGDTRPSAEGTCVAQWQMETGALTTDTLNIQPALSTFGSPAADGTNFREGLYSVSFDGSNALYLTDANLAAGFPLKTGDSNLKGTYCFWFRCTTSPGGSTMNYMICKWNWAGNALSIGAAIYASSNTFRVSWGYGTGQNQEVWDPFTITLNQWYHVGMAFDGVAKTTKLRIWNVTAQTVTNYSKTWNSVMRAANSSPFIIGSETITSGGFKGQIDEVLVFNGPLYDPAIDSIRQSAYAGLTASLNTSLEVISPTSNDLYIDDVVINNSSGSVNNSWPDNIHVVGLSPRSDVSTGWSVEPYSPFHWHRALPYPPPLASAWAGRMLSVGSPGLTELFGLEASPGGLSTNVMAIQANCFARSAITTGAAITVLHSIVQVGSTIFESTDLNLTNSFAWYGFTWETNPVTGQVWTADDLGNIRLGVLSIR